MGKIDEGEERARSLNSNGEVSYVIVDASGDMGDHQQIITPCVMPSRNGSASVHGISHGGWPMTQAKDMSYRRWVGRYGILCLT